MFSPVASRCAFFRGFSATTTPPVIPDARAIRDLRGKIPDSLRKCVGFGDDGWKSVPLA